MKAKTFLAAFILAVIFFPEVFSQTINYPRTEKVTQTDNYFETKVEDPYRWMENIDSSAVTQWVNEENKITNDYLGKIPYRDKIKNRLEEIWNYPKYTAPWREGNNYFFYKNNGLQNQSVLYIQKGLDAPSEVFLDPNTFSSDGTGFLSGISFSHDGKYCAYGVSHAGSDWKEFFVMEVETKKKLDDHIQWVKFSDASWMGDKGFYYTRYNEPKAGEEYSSSNQFAKVYFHTLGKNQSEDKLIFEDREHPFRGSYVWLTEDEMMTLMSQDEKGKRGNSLAVYNSATQSYSPVISDFENEFNVIDNLPNENKLLVMTNKNSPNYCLVLIDPSIPQETNWKIIIPEKSEPLQRVSLVGGKLFAQYTEDVTSRVYVYDLKGNFENEIQLPALGTAGGFGGKKEDEITFYTFTSFTYPPAIYKYDIKTKTSTLYRKSEVKFNPDDYETKQVFYPSADGQKIPMFIVHKKGIKLDGSNPTYLYGYGGFNISINPDFSTTRLILLENGFVYAQANMRGGSEYGEKWHEGGMLLNKQNVFDDYITAAEYLIKEKYTSPENLVCSGRSNGGLLIGAVINQRPDLFKVALPAVGVMDMLRFQKFTIGWAWVTEYGSSEDSVQFRNLFSYSPLHNIKNQCYPATLITTGDHDDRVMPGHSYKYAATIQEKQSCSNPVLIRIDTQAGHGGGKPISKIIDEWADIYAFVFWNLGIKVLY